MIKVLEMDSVGEMLKKEFLIPYGLSVQEVADTIGFPAWQISAVVENGIAMTTELDLLLAKYFGLSEGFFMRWQESYNLRKAKRLLRKRLAEIIPFEKLNRTAVL